jgi:hypothetical protein
MFNLDDDKGPSSEFSFDADKDRDANVKMAFGDLEEEDDDNEGWADSNSLGATVSFGDEQGINATPMADQETDLDWSKIGDAFTGMSKFF